MNSQKRRGGKPNRGGGRGRGGGGPPRRPAQPPVPNGAISRKGTVCLISESVSILKKMCQMTILTISSQGEDAHNSNLESFLRVEQK